MANFEARTILLVDDSPDDAELARIVMRNAGLRNPLVILDSGERGLNYLLRSGDYSVLADKPLPILTLLDLKLTGGISGLAVLERLREYPATRLLPVAVFTGTDDHAQQIVTARRGAVWIRKPLTTIQLLSALQQLGLGWLITEGE